MGCTYLTCRQKQLPFYIVNTTQDPILGLSASQELGIIIKITCHSDHFVNLYPKLFTGLGCLKTPYHIQTDPSVTPVVTPCRNHPVGVRDRLKQTLSEMETMGVIRTHGLVNSLEMKLRICLDPRPLNNAIRREHFQLPTLEDITT